MRGCLLVVVASTLGYAHCSCSWKYFLSMDIGGVRCIAKNQIESSTSSFVGTNSHLATECFTWYIDLRETLHTGGPAEASAGHARTARSCSHPAQHLPDPCLHGWFSLSQPITCPWPITAARSVFSPFSYLLSHKEPTWFLKKNEEHTQVVFDTLSSPTAHWSSEVGWGKSCYHRLHSFVRYVVTVVTMAMPTPSRFCELKGRRGCCMLRPWWLHAGTNVAACWNRRQFLHRRLMVELRRDDGDKNFCCNRRWSFLQPTWKFVT